MSAVLPGEHPHADRPNWTPATTIYDYRRNCREGLEVYSDKRAATLLGWSRIQVYRARLMAELPEQLLDDLLAARLYSSRGLANIALALMRGHQTAEVERCPHCGEVLRVRGISARHLAIVNSWLAANGAAP